MTPLKNQAIQTALTGDWTTAIALNEQILQEFPDDTDTLNRIAFAHASLGNTDAAKKAYESVLAIDDQNQIALKNLKRLDSGTMKKATNGHTHVSQATMFIEESGKTKVIDLVNTAEQKITAQLRSGESLTLSVKRMKIFALDQDKQYIGMLPDDVGMRLIKFMEDGNAYESYVKTVNSHRVSVFLRETVRSSKLKNQPSFVSQDKSKLTFDTKSQAKSQTSGQKVAVVEDDDDAYSGDDSETESL